MLASSDQRNCECLLASSDQRRNSQCECSRPMDQRNFWGRMRAVCYVPRLCVGVGERHYGIYGPVEGPARACDVGRLEGGAVKSVYFGSLSCFFAQAWLQRCGVQQVSQLK